MHLPSRKKCSLEHMNSVMSDDKKALSNDQCVELYFPTLLETSLEKLWPIAQQNAEVLRYMPSSLDKPSKADRNYVVMVLSTLYPDFMMELADDVAAQRQELRDLKATKAEEVTISDEWLLALHRCTFKPGKLLLLVLHCIILFFSP